MVDAGSSLSANALRVLLDGGFEAGSRPQAAPEAFGSPAKK